MACPPHGRRWLEVIKCPGIESGVLWGRDSYWFGDNVWKQRYHLVSVSHKIWHKQLHQTDELSKEPDIQQRLRQPLQHQRDRLCSCKCFHSSMKDQTIAMSSVYDQLFPVGTVKLCAFHKTSMHWLTSNFGSWHSRSLFWVSRGVNFSVSQQLLFWLRLFVPALPFLRLLLIAQESCMEKHSHKATGSFVSTLG